MEMLGALVGLVGAGLQASAQANSLAYQYAHFNWEKQRADKQDWFAQAAREDMYGNVTGYDPVLNKWSVKLTPDQLAIRDAQEKEQLLQLTKDAPAARKIREAIQQRAYEAKEPFHRASIGYQYDQPKSEGAIRSELTNLMATNDMLRSKADQALIMRQAARMGRGGRAADIIQSVDQELGNADKTRNRMLEARKQALAEYGQRMQQHEAQWGTPMKVWGDLMGQGGDIPNIGKGNLDQSINSMINSQMQGMQSALGNKGVGSAFDALAKAAGQSPDLSNVVKALSSQKFAQKQAAKDGSSGGSDDTYDPTVMAGTSTFGKSGWSDGGRNDYGWESSSWGDYF